MEVSEVTTKRTRIARKPQDGAGLSLNASNAVDGFVIPKSQSWTKAIMAPSVPAAVPLYVIVSDVTNTVNQAVRPWCIPWRGVKPIRAAHAARSSRLVPPHPRLARAGIFG